MRGVERRDGAKSNDPRLSGAERTLAIGCVCAVRRSTAAIFGRRPQRDRSWCRCWRYSPGPLGSWLRVRRFRAPLFRPASGSPHDGAPHRTECIPDICCLLFANNFYFNRNHQRRRSTAMIPPFSSSVRAHLQCRQTAVMCCRSTRSSRTHANHDRQALSVSHREAEVRHRTASPRLPPGQQSSYQQHFMDSHELSDRPSH
jgi:hypothetical protein